LALIPTVMTLGRRRSPGREHYYSEYTEDTAEGQRTLNREVSNCLTQEQSNYICLSSHALLSFKRIQVPDSGPHVSYVYIRLGDVLLTSRLPCTSHCFRVHHTTASNAVSSSRPDPTFGAPSRNRDPTPDPRPVPVRRAAPAATKRSRPYRHPSRSIHLTQ
jgi:hypothetical protein